MANTGLFTVINKHRFVSYYVPGCAVQTGSVAAFMARMTQPS